MKKITVIVRENDDNGFKSGKADLIHIVGIGKFKSQTPKVFRHFPDVFSLGKRFKVNRNVFLYENHRDWHNSYKDNSYKLGIYEASKLVETLHWSKHWDMIEGDFQAAYTLETTGQIHPNEMLSYAK